VGELWGNFTQKQAEKRPIWESWLNQKFLGELFSGQLRRTKIWNPSRPRLWISPSSLSQICPSVDEIKKLAIKGLRHQATSKTRTRIVLHVRLLVLHARLWREFRRQGLARASSCASRTRSTSIARASCVVTACWWALCTSRVRDASTASSASSCEMLSSWISSLRRWDWAGQRSCVCVCCVCVCVCEREREREREYVCVCVFLFKYKTQR
jgi:hypothetical protein